MGFGISTRSLRHLPDYAAAKAMYEGITPIRGNSSNIRPLGNRRDQHMRIEEDAGVYHAVLYRTRCVSYYSDGMVGLYSGGHMSNSTAAFMHAVSPFHVNKEGGRLWVGLPSGTYALGSNELRIGRDECGQWQVLNPVQLYMQSFNRDTTKKLRAHLKPLLDWLQITMTLMRGEDGNVEFNELGQRGGIDVELLNPGIPEDPSEFFGRFRMALSTRYISSNTPDVYRTKLLKHLYTSAVRLGLCTREELYVSTPVPLGEQFIQRAL